MAKSIMQIDKSKCYLCGRNGNGDPLEEHHVFGGSNRKLSEKDGLKVYLCGNRCHRNGKKAAHKSALTSSLLKAKAQAAWESLYGSREEFMGRYGRNYL